MDIFELFRSIEKKPEEKTPVTHLIVGLGNPGREYEKTRHNVGFMMLDALAKKYNISVTTSKFHALIGEGSIDGVRAVLMKPQTYMNNSGEAVGECARFYKIPPENILILCDEISFDVGIFRIRRKGSAGGHNGLKSIIAHLGSEGFPRFKIGVGNKPTPEYDLASWVLSRFPEGDIKTLSSMEDAVIGATLLSLKGDIDTAMNRYSK
jgi:PTH1 family peptidyl-tRNA hydrolase